MTKFAGKWKASVRMVDEPRTMVVTGNPMRQPDIRPKPGKFEPGVGASVQRPSYTGTEMLGIGVAHKSGLQPVFSQEQAEDLARMRR